MTAILVNQKLVGGFYMADYQKMYAALCGAIDDVIGPLEHIPLAHPQVRALRAALLHAEEIFLETDTAPLEGEIHILPPPAK